MKLLELLQKLHNSVVIVENGVITVRQERDVYHFSLTGEPINAKTYEKGIEVSYHSRVVDGIKEVIVFKDKDGNIIADTNY